MIYIGKKTARNKCISVRQMAFGLLEVPHLLSGLHTHDFTQTPRIDFAIRKTHGGRASAGENSNTLYFFVSPGGGFNYSELAITG